MANPNHDERGRFSSGSGGSSLQAGHDEFVKKLAGHQEKLRKTLAEAKSKFESSFAHGSAYHKLSSASRERIDAAMRTLRASDARGKDQPTSRSMTLGRIVSRQTRTDPERKDRSGGGRGRSFFG